MGALRDFVADLLETEGSAVERVEPDGLDVLASERVRSALNWPEMAALGFGPVPASGAMRVGFEGEWLDRFGTLFGVRGRWAERQVVLACEVPAPPDPERLLDRAFNLPNAVWRCRGVRPAFARCLLLGFRFTALADDKRDGFFWIGFNQSTGAVLHDILPRLLPLWLAQDTEWQPPAAGARYAAGPAWDAATIEARASPLLQYCVQQELEPFIRATRRRLDRDRKRVHEYHENLRVASLKRVRALNQAANEKADAERRREAMRIAAIEREYAAKIEDLRHNYAMRVTVEWIQALELFVPVQRHEILVKRRKGERLIRLDWHAAIRSVEAPLSDFGIGIDRTRFVCDDRLHLTDADGQAPCRSCGKVRCHACHPKTCPRCGAAAA